MIETYDVVWGQVQDGGLDGEFHEILHESVEAETADEAARSSSFTAQVPGHLRVYKTFLVESKQERGQLVRAYRPDDYGYTWVPATELKQPLEPEIRVIPREG